MLFKQQYEQWSGVLNALEEGEKCLLEEYNEAYDDWYNSSVDEILYEDPDEIGKDLDEICKFIHKCTDAEEYQYGMEIGADGVKRISDKLIIRSEVALKTSEYAITVNADRSLIEKYYVEAFRSDTNAVNYLRAFLNSANQDTCRQELKEIYSAYIRRGGRYSGYYDYGSMRVNELAENEPGKNMVYVLRLLGGAFMEVLRLGVSEKDALGWSATFMKQGLAFFLFYLSDGKNLGKGISEMAKITRYVFGFDIAAYSKGQKKIAAKDEMSFFTDIFMKWKKETEIGESDREKILRHIEKQMEKRVVGIMDANRRKYYGECASYIAAIGEIREYPGERGGKQMLMSRYAAEYSRRSAFRTELQNYGWVKSRK